MNIVIILAGGKSKRIKGINKLFFEIKKKPLIFYTIFTFEKHPKIDKIILVARKSYFKKFTSLIKKYHFKKVKEIIEGGSERQDSAFLGLKMAQKLGAKPGDLILFHNAANPLVSKKEIGQLIKFAKKHKTALLGQPAIDTIKEVDKNNFLVKTIDRKKIYLAQTPQAIEYNLAKLAFEKAFKDGYQGTDDVSLVERLGKKVKIIPCSPRNFKVTTKDDLKKIKVFLENK